MLSSRWLIKNCWCGKKAGTLSILLSTVLIETSRKHYRLIEQLESAATSIPMNIAEGKGRISNKEFIHFLYIAKGSLYETLTLLEIFLMRGWLSKEQFKELGVQSNEIAKMINGLIRSIANSSLHIANSL
jgi:four helix bundle protein